MEGSPVSDLGQRLLDASYLEGDFVLRPGLGMDKRIAAVVTPGEEIRSGLTTEIAVNTLLINIEFARDIVGPFVGLIGHSAQPLVPVFAGVKEHRPKNVRGNSEPPDDRAGHALDDQFRRGPEFRVGFVFRLQE